MGPPENAANQEAFAKARELLATAASASGSMVARRVERARTYHEFNERFLNAQHQRYLLRQAIRSGVDRQAKILREAIRAKEEEMIAMAQKSRETKDGVLDYRFFVPHVRARLQADAKPAR